MDPLVIFDGLRLEKTDVPPAEPVAPDVEAGADDAGDPVSSVDPGAQTGQWMMGESEYIYI